MILKRLSSHGLMFVLLFLLSGLTLPVSAQSNGKLIVSMSARVYGLTSRQQIFAINADGSGRVRLTQTKDDEKHPVVSPDGTKIAFVSHRDGTDQIYVMNIDGSNPINVDGDPNDYFDSPVWSPDSTRLLFHSSMYHAEAQTSYGELWVSDANGSNKHKLRGSPEGSPIQASWSPSGHQILFREDSAAGEAIWVMNDSGSGALRLTDPAGQDYSPVWSPDGAQIAFVRYQGQPGIWTMNDDGSDPVRWIPDVKPSRPVWSPDGQSMAYIDAPRGVNEIFIAPIGSANAVPAARDSGTADLDFAWSPDGTQIAATVNGMSPHLGELAIIDVVAQTRTLIVSDTYVSDAPAWVPQPRAVSPHERKS